MGIYQETSSHAKKKKKRQKKKHTLFLWFNDLYAEWLRDRLKLFSALVLCDRLGSKHQLTKFTLVVLLNLDPSLA